MTIRVLGAVLGATLLAGCAGLTDTEQRLLTGGTLGAAGGAAIGSLSGNAGLGAGIGAAAGLAGGYLFDQHRQAEERAYQQGLNDARARQ